MEKSKLEIAKEIIKENYKSARCGIFDCRSLVGDTVTNIYHKDGLDIYICYDWEYFEVFGLSTDEFGELVNYYNELRSK
jgi:hypothetical protein